MKTGYQYSKPLNNVVLYYIIGKFRLDRDPFVVPLSFHPDNSIELMIV